MDGGDHYRLLDEGLGHVSADAPTVERAGCPAHEASPAVRGTAPGPALPPRYATCLFVAYVSFFWVWFVCLACFSCSCWRGCGWGWGASGRPGDELGGFGLYCPFEDEPGGCDPYCQFGYEPGGCDPYCAGGALVFPPRAARGPPAVPRTSGNVTS